jgi:hypothetical protein
MTRRFSSALAAGLAIAAGIVLAYVQARAVVGGPLRSFSHFTTSIVIGFVIAGCIFIVVGLLARGRPRRFLFLGALVGISQAAIIPIGRALYDGFVSDAKAHCAALASIAGARRDATFVPLSHIAGRKLPLLCQPGYSSRYPFAFERDGLNFTCTFPDPLARRAAWHGSSDGQSWSWELLMD